MKKPIIVGYQYVDGVHFFASEDPRAEGLCVAHPDPAAAYGEVGRQLTILLQKNQGIKNAQCVPAEPIEDFLAWLKEQASKRSKNLVTVPTAHINWQQEAMAA